MVALISRLRPRLFGFFVRCDDTAQNILPCGVLVRVVRDAPDQCAARPDPFEGISRDGSSDRSV